ncbi:hypothetical protein DM01DRAFT_265393, partial [Hesseltinella vesiculosa]
QDRIDIFIMHQSMSRTHFEPVAGTAAIEEPGIIWHLDFLHTESQTWDRILMAAVVYSDLDRTCRIILYCIDASIPHNPTVELIGRLPMNQKMTLPVLFFSLPFLPEASVLVTEETISVIGANDIACGNVFYPSDICTAYSFSANPASHRLLLGTAEGALLQLDLEKLDAIELSFLAMVNPIGQHMQSFGFTTLLNDDGSSSNVDFVFCCGESADSQLLGITLDEVIVLQSLVNRAPLTDAADTATQCQTAQMIVCSGQNEHGSLRTISYDCDSVVLANTGTSWKG